MLSEQPKLGEIWLMRIGSTGPLQKVKVLDTSIKTIEFDDVNPASRYTARIYKKE